MKHKKLLSGKYDRQVALKLLLYLSDDHHMRGNSHKLLVKRCHYDLRKYFFSNCISNIWNSLPDSVVMPDPVNQFKHRLDKYWKNECWNIRSQDYSFPGTFIPMMELSFSGPFVPCNFRSQDYSFPETFVPWTVRSLELSFPGPFVTWTIRSRERINTADLSLLGPFVPWTVHSLHYVGNIGLRFAFTNIVYA